MRTFFFTMKKITLSLFVLFGILSCSDKKDTPAVIDESKDSVVVEEYIKQPLFTPIAQDFSSDSLIIPEGFKYDVLFTEGIDMVTRADGKSFPAKDDQDMLAYIPIDGSSEHGYLYVSHETKYSNDDLGDGGGATIIEVKKENGSWKNIGTNRHVDFSTVGGTIRNCGGAIAPNGNILSCEEVWSKNTKHIYRNGMGFRDTSWYMGRPRWQNFGFIVEIDPKTAKVVKKHYNLGKFLHEDVHPTKDGKTLYMTDDMNRAVFFKFEADVAHDYSKGKLFAYQQSEDGESGKWLELPNDSTTFYYTRRVAIENGATLFLNHEWIAESNGKLYISESGDDDRNFDWKDEIKSGGKPAFHHKHVNPTTGKLDDPYGRILEFDMSTNKMSVLINGGTFSDSSGNFANPDCNTILECKNGRFLVINEDLHAIDKGRVDAENLKKKLYYNEVFFLDLDIQNPTTDSLKRFAIGPKGSETSGGVFTPDGNTYFLNIMHPNKSNKKPFDKSITIAITGFKN